MNEYWYCVLVLCYIGASQVVSGEKSTFQCRRWGFDPWVRKIPWSRKCNSLQYSCLENAMDKGTWQTSVHGVAVHGHDWVNKQLCYKPLSLYVWDFGFVWSRNHSQKKKMSKYIELVWPWQYLAYHKYSVLSLICTFCLLLCSWNLKIGFLQ